MKLFTLVADLTLNTAGFVNQVRNAEREGRGLANALGADAESINKSFDNAFSFAAGDILADVVQAGLQAMGEFVGGSVETASNLQEVNSKIDAIFGDMSSRLHAWATTTKTEFGIGEYSAKSYASNLAGLLSADSIGLTTEQIYEMSTGMVQLAGDLASFHNMSFDVVWGKLLSGMRGETEAIEDLGVDLRATAMAAYLGLGSEKDWGKLDQQTRTLATYQYIMENTTVAQGDFVRTQDQYANQQRIFNENLLQLQATIGEGLLPAMTGLLTWFNSFFNAEADAATGIETIQNAYSDSVVSIETTTTNALALVSALESLEGATEDAAGSDMWNAILTELESTLPKIGNLIDDETGKITGGTEALRGYIEQWKTTSMELARQQYVQDMYDEYAQMQAEIARLQMEQEVADIRQAGATESMANVSEQLLGYMLSGMEAMGASEEDISAMSLFGAKGAGGLLARIANGGSANLIMSALLEGGDWKKNKDFMTYFEKGGGSEELLEQMANLYSEYQQIYEEYDIDNTAAIAERQALLANQQEEITILQQILAQLATNGTPVVDVTVTNTADTDVITTKVEKRFMNRINEKAFAY